MAEPSRTYPIFLLGLLLLGAAGVLGGIAGGETFLPRILLVAGLLVFGWACVRSGDSLQFFLFRSKAIAEPGPSLSFALAGAVAWLLAMGLGLQGVRVDLTARRVNSLSVTSRQALGGLQKEIEIVAAFRESAAEHDQAIETLAVYRAASGKITTRALDPDREPEEARRLGIERPDVFVIRAGETREEVVTFEESDLTQAILRVEDPARPLLAVLEGHGETAEGRGGLSAFKQVARQGGLVYRTLRLAEMVEVPSDVRALVIPGVETPLLPGEVAAIERFLDRGGRLAVLIEPDAPSGLEPFLARKGIRVDGRRVRDESPLTRSLGRGPETVAVNRFAEHPITYRLGVGVVLPGATAIALAEKPLWGTSGSDLLRTGNDARFLASAGVESSSEAQVLSLGVVLEWEAIDIPGKPGGSLVPEKPYARIVAIGDSDFLRDGTIELYGNRELTGRVLGWLAEREFLLRFPPVDRSGTPLRVGQGGLTAIFWGMEVLLPLGAFAMAFRTWVRRR